MFLFSLLKKKNGTSKTCRCNIYSYDNSNLKCQKWSFITSADIIRGSDNRIYLCSIHTINDIYYYSIIGIDVQSDLRVLAEVKRQN